MLAALFTILPALVTLVAAAPADSLVSSGSTALPATTGSITTITMGNIPGAKTATPSPTTTNTGSHASHPATSALASYTAWNQKPTGILPAPSQAPSTSSPSDFADVKLPSLEPRYVNFVVPHGGAVRYIKDGTVGADEKLSVGPSNADNYTFYLWNSTAGPVSAQCLFTFTDDVVFSWTWPLNVTLPYKNHVTTLGAYKLNCTSLNAS